MLKIFFFIFLGCSLSNDLIIIGDYRIEEMGNVLMGVEYSKFSFAYSTRYGIMTNEPIQYEDYNLKIIGTDIINSLIRVGEEVYNFVQSQLKSAKDGTNVLFSIGVDCQDRFNDIFVFYGKLADRFPNLNFYVLSIIGVDESLVRGITNAGVREFNTRVKNRIEMAEFSNMKYISILNEDDPTKIIVDDKIVDLLNYVSEGIGFFKAGYAKIFKAMVGWLN